MTYRLITPYFNPPLNQAARQSELEWCLQRNCESFGSVTALTEPTTAMPGWYNRDLQMFSGQQKFSDALDAATGARSTDLVVIANADIYIPRATLELIDRSIEATQAYCLARWDFSALRGVDLFNVADAQDCWVFRGPPLPLAMADFCFGEPGSDNRLAHELTLAGYEVLNPSRDVRVYHVHLIDYRGRNTPARRVPIPYLCISPHALGEKPVYHRPTRAGTKAGYHWK